MQKTLRVLMGWATILTATWCGAAKYEWSGVTSGDWNTPGNWTNNAVPGTSGTDDVWLMAAGFPPTNQNIPNLYVHKLVFNTNAAGFAIGGQGLTFRAIYSYPDAGAFTQTNAVNVPLALGGAAADSYVYARSVVLLNAPLGETGGAHYFSAYNSGRVVLLATNTLTGGLRPQQGTFQIFSDSNCGAVPASYASNYFETGVGTLQVSSTSTFARLSLHTNRGMRSTGTFNLTVDPNVKLTCNAPIVGSAFRRPGGAGTGVLLLGGNSSFSGDAKFDAGLTILTHSNALGAGATAANLINLIGTLDLNGNNITSRYVNFVNGSGLDSMGELRNTDLGRTSTVAVNCNVGAVGSVITHVGGPGDIAISGSLTNVATFVKTGTGTLTLKGSNTFTSHTVCRNGGLVLDYGTDNSSKLSDTADLRLSQAAVRFAGSSGAATTETIAHLGIGTEANMPAGGSSVTVEPAPNRNLTLAAQAIAFGGNNAVDFDLRTNGTGVGSVTTTNSNGVLAGARATVGRSTWAKVSGGTVTGMADGEYATTFDGGNNATHVDAPAGGQTISNTTTGQTIRFAAALGSTVTISTGKTLWLSAYNTPPPALTPGILMTPDAGPVTIDGDGLLDPGVNKTVYVNQYSTNLLTISARIGGLTGANLMKLGPGELRLTHTNNVLAAADLILVGGTLTAMNIATGGAPCSIGSGKTPPTISLIQMGNATLKYIGTGDRHNRRIEMRGPAAVDASGSGTLSFMGLTNVALNAKVEGNDYPLTLTGSGSGVMEGVLDIRQGSVIKDGAGAWTIGGTQPYVGNTVVTNGMLFLTNNCVLQRSLYVRPAGTLAGSATIGEDLVLNGARRVVLRSDSDRDMLNVGYDVALGGTLVVSNAPGYTPPVGVFVPIATTANGTISGAFAGVTGGYTVSIASGQVLLAYTPPPPAGTIIMVR